jgi:hypothetical protein
VETEVFGRFNNLLPKTPKGRPEQPPWVTAKATMSEIDVMIMTKFKVAFRFFVRTNNVL